jgi:hypothetical protein
VNERSTILWQRLDMPGHEFCELSATEAGWKLTGVAVFNHDAHPCRVEYDVGCDASWETQCAHISGEIDGAPVNLSITRAPDRAWSANGVQLPAVHGCIDVDLGFSPSTNLLPIRRLRLAVGEKAQVNAAWVRFPDLSIEVLSQLYTRTGENTYRYESAGGAFTRDLNVDAAGFVVDYPGLWRREA